MELLVELPSVLIMPFTIVVAMVAGADAGSPSRWYPLTHSGYQAVSADMKSRAGTPRQSSIVTIFQ